MKAEPLSDFGARIIQVIAILFSLFLLMIILKVILNTDYSIRVLLFLVFAVAFITVKLKISLTVKDIYIQNDQLIIKDIFQTKIRNRLDVDEVDGTIFPNYFFIRMKNSDKIYFRVNPDFISMSLTEPRTTHILEILRNKLGLKNSSSISVKE